MVGGGAYAQVEAAAQFGVSQAVKLLEAKIRMVMPSVVFASPFLAKNP